MGSETEAYRESQIHRLFESLEEKNTDYIDSQTLTSLLVQRYETFDGIEDVVDQLLHCMGPAIDGKIKYTEFKDYVNATERALKGSFHSLDANGDGYFTMQDMMRECKRLNITMDGDQAAVFFECLDADGDGRVSFSDWTHQLLFIPSYKDIPPLRAAYVFFIDDLSSEGDVIISSETSHGLGYFLAGGLAGVVSRTCTAPFDRLKVYLIAQSGTPIQQTVKTAVGTAAASSAKTNNTSGPIRSALRTLWKQGGVRAFFVGNGLNVVKVFPESAMKFGSFEAAKRFLAKVEGVEDTSQLSRGSTFLAGGLGGMAAQLTVYPIDTLKFRVQCEAQYSQLRGNQLMMQTAGRMWADGGVRTFYRGLYVGVLGIFPFAALDLGIFSAMKKAYIANQAHKQNIDESDVTIGNFVVLTMGAMSGSVGASVVYPVNLLRTRLQAQGTTAHPYRYDGFLDVFRKTVQRDGYMGLFRGLAPNLAKVAPSVSISYLVYENAKSFMHLD